MNHSKSLKITFFSKNLEFFSQYTRTYHLKQQNCKNKYTDMKKKQNSK